MQEIKTNVNLFFLKPPSAVAVGRHEFVSEPGPFTKTEIHCTINGGN